MKELIHNTINFFTDIKTYLALSLVPFIQGFYGPAYDLAIIIFITAFADVLMGYLKDKKVNNAKFSLKKLANKGKQFGSLMLILTLAIYNDPFFCHMGLNKYAIAITVCVTFGNWQFLRILANVSMYLPQEIKAEIKKRLMIKFGLREETKEKKDEII